MRSSPLALVRAGLPEGRTWYPLAEQVVRRLAAATGRNELQAASVLAITSPRVQVRRNVLLAEAYMRGQPMAMLPGTVAALAHREATGEIRGPKTAAFRDALLGDTDAVVIDVHVWNAFGFKQHGPLRALRRLQATLRGFASRLGETPRETQAALWVAYRASQGYKPAPMEPGWVQ